jgi:hypothetical protein
MKWLLEKTVTPQYLLYGNALGSTVASPKRILPSGIKDSQNFGVDFSMF